MPKGFLNVDAERNGKIDHEAVRWLHQARTEPPDPQACRHLWLSVLEDALMLTRYRPRGWEMKEGRNTITERAQALSWLRSESDDPCSFIWVCGLLDLDAEAVRDRAFGKAAA